MGRAALKMETTETQWKLREWARWRLIQSGVAQGFSNATPIRKMFGGSVVDAMISDLEAERIDRAVCELARRNQNQHLVLVLHYVEELPVQTVASRCGISYELARRLIAQAETAIEYLLEMFDNSGLKL